MNKTILGTGLFMVVMTAVPTLGLAEISPIIDPVSQSSCIELKKDIGFRSRDTRTRSDVSLLQKFLASKGHFDMEPTGYFGAITQRAVKRLQIQKGISPTGYVGPYTRDAIKKSTCVIIENEDLFENSESVTASTTNIISTSTTESIQSSSDTNDSVVLSNNEVLFSGEEEPQESDDILISSIDTNGTDISDTEITPVIPDSLTPEPDTSASIATSTTATTTSTSTESTTTTSTTTIPTIQPSINLTSTIDAIQGENKNFTTVTFKATYDKTVYTPASVTLAVTCPAGVYGNIPGEDTERCDKTMDLNKISEGLYQITLKFRNTTFDSLTVSVVVKALRTHNRLITSASDSATVNGKNK